ncbi:MAG: hypothetical protein JKY34_10735 [Kordiimonadaceae bacterium]|nr:hypothetical protein [Kordiimonadaceae bacterium]
MADTTSAMQSRNAGHVSQVERSSLRGPVRPVRPASPAGVFQSSISTAQAGISKSAALAQKPQPAAGRGLLANSVHILLAETRTQEATSSFVPSSSVGPALERYTAAQTKVKETIREAAAFGRAPIPASVAGGSEKEDASKVGSPVAATVPAPSSGGSLPLDSRKKVAAA